MPREAGVGRPAAGAPAAALEVRKVRIDSGSDGQRLDNVNIHVVPGSDRNIKITKPSDLYLAKLFLAEEKERHSA